jgi:hypothetical protein
MPHERAAKPLFDVLHADGARTSNRRVPRAVPGGPDERPGRKDGTGGAG